MLVSLKKFALCTALSLGVLNLFNSAQAALPLEGKTLAVGFSIAPPFVSAESSITNPSGIEVEIVYELQRRTGFKLKGGKLEIMNFSDVMDFGANGQLDICGGGISLTESRSKTFDFSYPYYTSRTVIVTNNRSTIKDFPDLSGRSIAAETGTTASDLIPPEYNVQNVHVDSTSTNFMAFYRVSRGLSDALVTDEPFAEAYIRLWPDSGLKIAKIEQGSDTDMGLIFKKGTPESKVLQQTIYEMALDGTLDKIVKKYTGRDFDYLNPEIIKQKQLKKPF